MILRKGKTKSLLESSIDCALLSVELYNKPRAPFRVESFITHMIMAWTRLLQAYFNQSIGDTFFFKEKNGRFKIIDGERKAWDLKTCINNYETLSEPVKTNLDFFIKLRNKIEHRIIDKEEIGLMIFGECQALLYNYENELIRIFGVEYAINESLAFSLQFSRLRTTKQTEASKQLLSSAYKEIKEFVRKYRENIKEDVFTSQEFSIKLIQVPKISNTGRNDLAVEFVNWSSLSQEDRDKYDYLTTIVKDRVIKTEAINPGKLKPSLVIKEVNEQSPIKINHSDHKNILVMFSVRPYKGFGEEQDPFETNTKYCHYDEAHKDYLYQERWVRFLISNLSSLRLTKAIWKQNYDERKTIDINAYEIE
ncbi:MAG: DUF3644 domain-containing protein [Bacteroidota bacterium]